MSKDALFDPETAVATYRKAVAHLDAERSDAKDGDAGRDEWRAILVRLRKQWSAWQGEDSLHEMAYGEPEE